MTDSVTTDDIISRLRAYDSKNHRGKYAVICREAAEKIEWLNRAWAVRNASFLAAVQNAGYTVQYDHSRRFQTTDEPMPYLVKGPKPVCRPRTPCDGLVEVAETDFHVVLQCPRCGGCVQVQKERIKEVM